PQQLESDRHARMPMHSGRGCMDQTVGIAESLGRILDGPRFVLPEDAIQARGELTAAVRVHIDDADLAGSEFQGRERRRRPTAARAELRDTAERNAWNSSAQGCGES